MEECTEKIPQTETKLADVATPNSQEINLNPDSKNPILLNEIEIDTQKGNKENPSEHAFSAETDFQREEREAAESGIQTPIQEITYVLLSHHIGSMSKEEAEEKLKALLTKIDPEQRRRYFEIHGLEPRLRENNFDVNKILQGIDDK